MLMEASKRDIAAGGFKGKGTDASGKPMDD